MSEHRAVLQKVSTNATNIFNIPLYIHTSNYYLSIWLISKLEIEELLGVNWEIIIKMKHFLEHFFELALFWL